MVINIKLYQLCLKRASYRLNINSNILGNQLALLLICEKLLQDVKRVLNIYYRINYYRIYMPFPSPLTGKFPKISFGFEDLKLKIYFH